MLNALRLGRPLFLLLPALLACRAAEPPLVAEARARKALYERQIAGLEETLAGMRKSGISRERLLIGVNEAVFREVVSATLPREVLLESRVSLRIEKAEPAFRYTQGVVVFECRLASVAEPSLFVTARLAGSIDRVDFVGGRLSAHLKIHSFEQLGSVLGDMGKGVIEALVRDNLDLVTAAIPTIEIPVWVEQAVAIEGVGEGPVSVKPGTLPFSASVACVLALNGRLWISLTVEAGPWKAGLEGEHAAAGPPTATQAREAKS